MVARIPRFCPGQNWKQLAFAISFALLIPVIVGVRIYTIIVAHQLGGGLAAVAAFFLPWLSECVVFIAAWQRYGFLNSFSWAFLLLAANYASYAALGAGVQAPKSPGKTRSSHV